MRRGGGRAHSWVSPVVAETATQRVNFSADLSSLNFGWGWAGPTVSSPPRMRTARRDREIREGATSRDSSIAAFFRCSAKPRPCDLCEGSDRSKICPQSLTFFCRPKSRVWGTPDIISPLNPDAFTDNNGIFTAVKAMALLPRPGMTGAVWQRAADAPKRALALDAPALQAGGHASGAGTEERLAGPSERRMSLSGVQGVSNGRGRERMNYSMARPAGISSSTLCASYSKDRPPTAIQRLRNAEANRLVGHKVPPDLEEPHLGRDRGADGEELRPAASRQGSCASGARTPPPGETEALVHSDNVQANPELSFDIGEACHILPQEHGHGAPTSNAPKPVAGRAGTSSRKEPNYEIMPVQERLQAFSKALTEQFPHAADAFSFIDDDGSGTLSIDELAEGLQHVGISITAKSLRDMMASLGLTTRSTILYKDFLKIFLGQFKPASQEDLEKKALAEAQDMLIRKLSKNASGSVNEDSLMKAFQAFDDNGDGWIDSDELQRGFLSFGLGDLYDSNSPMAPFKRLVDSCDDNGDGKINYKEFLELAGFAKLRSKLAVGSGAASGFRELSKFDAKILHRQKVRVLSHLSIPLHLGKLAAPQVFDVRLSVPQIKRMQVGDGDFEPETPKGLHVWRAKYASSFFGDKYLTRMERDAKNLVADKVEGRYVEPVAPWSLSKRRYMEQVLKVPPNFGPGGQQPSEAEQSKHFQGVQSARKEFSSASWSSQAHEDMVKPFGPGVTQKGIIPDVLVSSPYGDSRRVKSPPRSSSNQNRHSHSAGSCSASLRLPRVDGIGNTGTKIPGFMPDVHRQTGPFRKPNQLTPDWAPVMDAAVRASIRMTHSPEQKPSYLHEPPYDATLRAKTVKDVAADHDAEHGIDHTHVMTLRGPVDVHNPFSKFGGLWTLHDTVQDILHKSAGESVAPVQVTGVMKPGVDVPKMTEDQEHKMLLRGGEPEPVSGMTSTQLARIYNVPPKPTPNPGAPASAARSGTLGTSPVSSKRPRSRPE